jgi:hypothetical protein
MSTERLDDLYIRQPAPDADDGFLPLRLLASLVVGIAVANTALLAVFGVGLSLTPSSTSDGGEAGVLGDAMVTGLAAPFLLMLWGAGSTATWCLVRRDLACVAAIATSLAWLAFAS